MRSIFWTDLAAPTLGLYPGLDAHSALLDLTRLPPGHYQVQLLDPAGRVVQQMLLAAGRVHQLSLRRVTGGSCGVLVRRPGSTEFTLLQQRLHATPIGQAV